MMEFLELEPSGIQPYGGKEPRPHWAVIRLFATRLVVPRARPGWWP